MSWDKRPAPYRSQHQQAQHGEALAPGVYSEGGTMGLAPKPILLQRESSPQSGGDLQKLLLLPTLATESRIPNHPGWWAEAIVSWLG